MSQWCRDDWHRSVCEEAAWHGVAAVVVVKLELQHLLRHRANLRGCGSNSWGGAACNNSQPASELQGAVSSLAIVWSSSCWLLSTSGGGGGTRPAETKKAVTGSSGSAGAAGSTGTTSSSWHGRSGRGSVALRVVLLPRDPEWLLLSYHRLTGVLLLCREEVPMSFCGSCALPPWPRPRRVSFHERHPPWSLLWSSWSRHDNPQV